MKLQFTLGENICSSVDAFTYLLISVCELLHVYLRAFEGEDDEVAFVEQARLFGENIESNEDSNGVDFHKYFSVQYFTNSGFDSKISTEEIWFQKTN